ncbi:MAG: anti-sigma factor domain-containing protein [Solirubrobacteraceae bacterium]
MNGCGLDAAPYLLGALEPDEARAFVRHLDQCVVCRDEVASLAPVLDALPSCAPPHRVRPAFRRRMLRAVRAEPKRRARHQPLTPRAGWLALGLAVAVAVIVQLGSARPHEHVIHATIGQAKLRVAGSQGELVVDRLPALPADRTYELWVVSKRGHAAPSTLFGVTARGTADLGVPGDLHAVSRLLVTIEPRDGSLMPTTRAVIQLPLAYVQRSSTT